MTPQTHPAERSCALAHIRVFLTAVLFVFSPAVGETAVAQVQAGEDFPVGLAVDLTYSYYAVEGETPQQIHRSLEESGPRSGRGVFYGLTSVETGFRYRHVEEDSVCRLDDVGVRAQVVMTLPQWSGRSRAGRGTRSAWDDFLRRLMSHEAKHYRIIDRATREIYNTLVDLRAHSCTVLDRRATHAIQAASRRQSDQNQDLDLKTDHGTSDGAAWPPPGLASSP